MDIVSLLMIILIVVLLIIFPGEWAIAIENRLYKFLFVKNNDNWRNFFIGAAIFIFLNLFFQINVIIQIILLIILWWTIPYSSEKKKNIR